MAKQPLSESHPHLALEWHPIKNGELLPSQILSGSSKKVWWICNKGVDHEWQASPNKRSNGRGCPVCRGRLVVQSNCLATTHPEVAQEWHHTLNKGVSPFDVTFGNGKKVWWICKKDREHEWEASPNRRSLGKGCPFCANRKIARSNCLATTHPSLAKEWHPTRNEKLTPEDVIAGSARKVWWKCNFAEDHVYLASLLNRTHGKSCPICAGKKVTKSNCLAVTHPDIALEWHPINNGDLTAEQVLAGSNKKVWWKCNKGADHEWKVSVANRKNGTGCPICEGKIAVNSNCLATTNTKLSREWHPTLNKNLTPFHVVSGSSKRVWWRCGKGSDHTWRTSISNRSTGQGCPICSGNKVVLSNCLASTSPRIAKEWHPTKNGTLTPFDYTEHSGKVVWWKCRKGSDHEWKAAIGNRTKGVGCSICAGKTVVKSNCLGTTHPKVSKEWHPTLNGNLTPMQVIAGSNKKVWWKCAKGIDHEWRTSVAQRTFRKSGCPYCSLTPQSKQELVITFELKSIFNKIDPKGLRIRIDGKLITVDIYIPALNLGIEFDGSYWHKGNEAFDKDKTNKIKEAGYNIIRIREAPLRPIFKNDIISIIPFNGKTVVDNLVKKILEIFSVDSNAKQKINDYLAHDSIQNEKGFEKYIDNLLIEKSKRKR